MPALHKVQDKYGYILADGLRGHRAPAEQHARTHLRRATFYTDYRMHRPRKPKSPGAAGPPAVSLAATASAKRSRTTFELGFHDNTSQRLGCTSASASAPATKPRRSG